LPGGVSVRVPGSREARAGDRFGEVEVIDRGEVGRRELDLERGDVLGETLEPAPESLKKLQIDGPALLDLITQMGDNFGIAVGRLENVLAEAKRVGRNWLWRRNLMSRAFT